ncbi:unnamed protein product [Trifolium pratense]|uniref:Uncharacterized protein n=1 Tax=Trifolium pratense TaxID=57577 RepID=A0ACB0JB01_TRIPR|nr:unnamed protein product [Trifolium pratense]
MASSSRSYQLQTTYLKSTQEFNCFKEEKVSKALQEEEEKNKEEDWLKLGLGLSWKKIVDQNHIPNPTLVSSSSSSSSLLSSSSQTLFCPQIGLGLGFEDKGSCLESRKGKEGLEGLNCYNDHHHNNDNGTMLWPSSCQMMNPMNPSSSCEDLAMSIPSDSHDYLARNNHNQSGLWFTLRSFTNR